MAKGIRIGVASDAREFGSGVKSDIIKPLEGVADALDDVQRDGDRAGDKLEKAFEGARKETSKFKEEQQRAGRELQENEGKAARFGKGYKAGAAEATDSIKEVGDEASSTAKETAASFDGSAESITGAFQEVAANAFAGFGPAGMLAGLAAAAGIGIVVAKMEEGGEETAEFKQKVADLTAELIDAGREGGPSLDYMVDKLKELATSAEDGDESLSDLDDRARATGVSYRGLAQAYAGNSDALDAMIAKQKEQMEASLAADQANSDSTTSYGRSTSDKTTKLGELGDKLRELKEQTDEAAAAEALYVASGGPEMERKVAAIEQINEAYDDGVGAIEDYIDEESGIFDVEKYVTSMEARAQALKDYVNNLESSGLSPAAKAYLESQGQEAAAKFLAGYVGASPGVKSRLDAVWSEAGRSNSGSYGTALRDNMPATISGPRILIDTPNMNTVFAKAQSDLNGKGFLKISAKTVDARTGKPLD